MVPVLDCGDNAMKTIITSVAALSMCVGFAWLIWRSIEAAYRNGVADGYGFAKEPNNPGFAKAREVLKQSSSHRYEELNDA